MSTSVRSTISVPLFLGMRSLLMVPVCAAEPPAILWEKTFALQGSDTAHNICRTSDGGFAAKLASENERETSQKELTIPLCYAPYLAILIFFGIAGHKARDARLV